MSTDPTRTSESFHALLDLLKDSENLFLEQRNQSSEADFADAYKNLLDILAIGVDCYIDNDPANPHFAKIVSPWRKMGGDNAHALYDFAPLRGDLSYLVKGNRAGTAYLGMTLYKGATEDKVDVQANINSADLAMDIAGDFSVVISPHETDDRAPVHLRSGPDTNGIIMRQYFLDDDTSFDACFSIEVLGEADASPYPDLAEMSRRIRSLTNFLKGWTGMTPLPWPDEPEAYNQVCAPFNTGESTGHWSTPDNLHAFGFFRLEDNEALVIRGESPPCLYWSCHLWNACMQTFDYTRFNCAISQEQVQRNADGSWDLVIAKKNPGRVNWLDTGGRNKGFVYFRWLEAGSTPPPLQCRVISL